MWPAEFDRITRRGYRAEPSVYLTFDDGPDPEFTPKFLDILARYRVGASFFVLGEAAEQHPDLLQRILDDGHDLGIHAYSHRHPWGMSGREASLEVVTTFDLVLRTTNHRARLFRPPFGVRRKAMLKAATELGMETVLWNRSVLDWGIWGKGDAVAQRMARTCAGDIVLMHDARRIKNHPEVTLELLPVYLRSLHRRGLTCLPLTALVSDTGWPMLRRCR